MLGTSRILSSDIVPEVPAGAVTVTVKGTLMLPAVASVVVQTPPALVTVGFTASVMGTVTFTLGKLPVYLTWVPLAILESGLMTGLVAAEPTSRNL